MQSPISARDSALGIPEILSHIFDQLTVPIACLDDVKASLLYREPPTTSVGRHRCNYCGGSGEDPVVRPLLLGDKILIRRSALRAAALSCRRFSGPALDSLWQTMNSLFPLISILPSTTPNGTLYLRLSQCSPTILDRFSAYANRIRTLVVNGTISKNANSIEVHPSVYGALRNMRPHLLPSLHTLLVPSFSDQNFDVDVSLIGSSRLQRLEIGTYTGAPEVLETFIVSTSARAGSLSHVSLDCSLANLPADAEEAVLTAVAGVHSLALSSSTLSSLSRLSCLSGLRQLDIPVRISCQSLQKYLPKSFSMPHLRKLSVSGYTDSIHQFLPIFQRCKLESLSIYLIQPSIPSQIKAIADLIAKNWGETMLHSQFNFDDALQNRQKFGMIFDREFASLFLPGLLSLEVKNYPGCLGSQTPLANVASHLPAIQSLVLPPHQSGQEPTLDDLRSLAQSCPSLRHLSTSVNLDSKVEVTVEIPFLYHELHTLHVYASPIVDTWTVATNLDRTFPYLQKITTSPNLDATLYKKWREVERALDLCHRSRAGFSSSRFDVYK
ncbi:hypothetical protein BDN72DRAFT_963043 [Pluteus cervinus]|uniref:Uncharacterized protein n=1 Tax=Pluteus cervinus TaxID=181527 RepID=A0ACD3AG63_9AGAR|nr:hypothetical protein BDN72DRAFT_963043 [Pluteus cervinus]